MTRRRWISLFLLLLILTVVEWSSVGTKVALLPLCAEEPTVSTGTPSASSDVRAEELTPSKIVDSTSPHSNALGAVEALDAVSASDISTVSESKSGVSMGAESNPSPWFIPSTSESTVSNEDFFSPRIPAIRSGSGFLNSVPTFRGKQMLNEPVSSYSLIPRLRAEEISPSESLQPNTEPGNLPNSRIPLFSTPGFDPYGIHSPYFSGDPLAATSSPMSPQMPPFDSNAR
ncbi:MAG: hypothetical protein PHE53_03190, partial [Thermoguttaceae bacterium]|nr:hypothetical protein [Thermoguttaceae bacterium]